MRFSLIIPLAPSREIKIIESINKLNYPKESFEVIVKEGLNPSVNRNNGIKEAKGEIIGFLDDDAIVHSEILIEVDKFFKENPLHQIVGGPQLNTKNETFFGKYSGYTLASFFGTMSMSTRYKKTPLNLNANENHLTSANLFVKKKVFDKIKGFDPDLFPGEDPEFLARAKKNGFKIASSPNIIIYHKRRGTPKAFSKQLFNYGKTRLQKEKKNQTKPSPIFYTPALFVIYLILLIPISFVSTLFLLPLLMYFVISVLFSVQITVEHKDPLAVLFTPFIFLLLHISYGVGMLRFIGINFKAN